MSSLFKTTCPSCGTRKQRFGVLLAINRSQVTSCSACGEKIVSEVYYGRYVLLIVYVHISVAVLGVPIVLGTVAKDWLVVAFSLAAFLSLCWPVAAHLHANYSEIRCGDSRS